MFTIVWDTQSGTKINQKCLDYSVTYSHKSRKYVTVENYWEKAFRIWVPTLFWLLPTLFTALYTHTKKCHVNGFDDLYRDVVLQPFWVWPIFSLINDL